MQVHLVTLRYSPTLGGFDDRPLEDLTRNRELRDFREHFFEVDDVPHILRVVAVHDALVPATLPPPSQPQQVPHAPQSTQRTQRSSKDPSAELDEAGRRLFAAMRQWRARRARDDGVPPYIILTNRELIATIRECPNAPRNGRTGRTSLDPRVSRQPAEPPGGLFPLGLLRSRVRGSGFGG